MNLNTALCAWLTAMELISGKPAELLAQEAKPNKNFNLRVKDLVARDLHIWRAEEALLNKHLKLHPSYHYTERHWQEKLKTAAYPSDQNFLNMLRALENRKSDFNLGKFHEARVNLCLEQMLGNKEIQAYKADPKLDRKGIDFLVLIDPKAKKWRGPCQFRGAKIDQPYWTALQVKSSKHHAKEASRKYKNLSYILPSAKTLSQLKAELQRAVQYPHCCITAAANTKEADPSHQVYTVTRRS